MKRHSINWIRTRPIREARKDVAGWALLCLLAAVAVSSVRYATAKAQTIEAPRLEARR